MKTKSLILLTLSTGIFLSSCTLSSNQAKIESLNKADQTPTSTQADTNHLTPTPDSEDQILKDLNTPDPDITQDLRDLESALK
jgi:hypothetical protein